jgi:hypothetical protein
MESIFLRYQSILVTKFHQSSLCPVNGIIGYHLESFGIIGNHLESYGIIGLMESFGIIWNHLESYGIIWYHWVNGISLSRSQSDLPFVITCCQTPRKFVCVWVCMRVCVWECMYERVCVCVWVFVCVDYWEIRFQDKFFIFANNQPPKTMVWVLTREREKERKRERKREKRERGLISLPNHNCYCMRSYLSIVECAVQCTVDIC